jgi:hypothetical protein
MVLFAGILTTCSKNEQSQVAVDNSLTIEITTLGVRIGDRHCELPCSAEHLYAILGTPSSDYQLEGGGFLHIWKHFGIQSLGDTNDRLYSLSVVYTHGAFTGYGTESSYPGRIRIGDAILASNTHLDSLPQLGFTPSKDLSESKYHLERQFGKMRIKTQSKYPEGDGLIVVDTYSQP